MDLFFKFVFGLLNIYTVVSFNGSLPSNYKEPIKYVTLNNQPFQTRQTRVDINSNETLFYPFNVSVNKCGGSCYTNDDLYARE